MQDSISGAFPRQRSKAQGRTGTSRSRRSQRLAELPKDRPIVAYCREPYCLMAKDAVELLRKEGFKSAHLRDGVAEWGLIVGAR